MRTDVFDGRRLLRTEPRGGPVILCLHGFGDDAGVFSALTETIAGSRFEWLVPDLPGCCGSRPLSVAPGSIDALADWAASLLDSVGGGSVALIGHSIGSAIAVRLAQLDGGRRVRHVLSIEGNLTADDAYFSGQAALFEDPVTFHRSFCEAIERLVPQRPALVRYLEAVRRADARSLFDLGRSAAAEGVEDGFGRSLMALGHLGIDVTYLWSRAEAPVSTSVFVDRVLDRSEVEVVEFSGAGHWVMVDDPGLVAEVVGNAFGGVAP